MEVDWLVAGAGAGGMTGAVAAHALGGSVLVVEKEELYGGTTAKSGGVIWIPANHDQANAAVSDSVEEGYQYLKDLIGDSVADARIRAYANGAREMLSFMTQHSRVQYSALPAYMDYYENSPGYKSGGRSMDCAPFLHSQLGAEADNLRIGHYDDLLLPFNITVVEGRKLQEMNLGAYLLGAKLLGRYLLDIPARLKRKRDNRLALGPALIARLRRSLMDRDIPVWLNAPLAQLLTEGNRVTGGVVEREGKRITVRARRGVLLATGGFAQNQAMREKYQPASTQAAWTAAAPGATGDAVTLAQPVNAALALMHAAWWSPTYTIPDGRVLALIAGKSNPGSIMVSKLGKRFANEAQPYEDLVKAQHAAHARGEQTVPCYLIFDASYRRKYAIGHIKPGKVENDSTIPEENFSSGLVAKASSLRELAAQLDINADNLVATVEAFNENARKGEDPKFHRGASEHDKYYADKKVTPNPSLAPLETAPFYALRCEPGDLDTKGGLLCDEFARVLTQEGEPVPGLYAAGNASAAAMGDTYPGAGATIGSAMTFAYLAAKHALATPTPTPIPTPTPTPQEVEQ